jgi:hypothetical protein
MNMRRAALETEIVRDVPEVRLVMAICLILKQRTGQTHFESEDGFVAEFMATCSIRQLKLLREIALGLDLAVEGRLQ